MLFHDQQGFSLNTTILTLSTWDITACNPHLFTCVFNWPSSYTFALTVVKQITINQIEYCILMFLFSSFLARPMTWESEVAWVSTLIYEQQVRTMWDDSNCFISLNAKHIYTDSGSASQDIMFSSLRPLDLNGQTMTHNDVPCPLVWTSPSI